MMSIASPEIDEQTDLQASTSGPWQTIVWNDPVNLMSYVEHVFRQYFGFSRDRAHRLMLSVHHDGHAVVAEGSREQMELHTQAMHDYGLWATVREAGS